jgi:hypothetical protein
LAGGSLPKSLLLKKKLQELEKSKSEAKLTAGLNKQEKESLLKDKKQEERKRLEKEAIDSFLRMKLAEIKEKEMNASSMEPKRSEYLASINRARNTKTMAQ